MIASAIPQIDGSSRVCVSVALPNNSDGSKAPKGLAEIILQFESMELEQDRPVWEKHSTVLEGGPQYTADDANVLAYRKFCSAICLNRKPGQPFRR